MTTLTQSRLASRADAWAALDPSEQRRILGTHLYHSAVYAQAVGLRLRNPPKAPPAGRESWGALDNIPSAEWEAKTA